MFCLIVHEISLFVSQYCKNLKALVQAVYYINAMPENIKLTILIKSSDIINNATANRMSHY